MHRCSCVKTDMSLPHGDRRVDLADAWPVYVNSEGGIRKDHFIMTDSGLYAGTHIIADLWGVREAGNLDLMEQTLRKAVDVSGATLLHIHLHHFSPNGGISGVAVLAESHISVHTWPEYAFAAFDIFMCGSCDPAKALEVIEESFVPERICVKKHIRGGSDSHEDLQGTFI